VLSSATAVATHVPRLLIVAAALTHSDNDLLALEEAVKDSLLTMRKGGYFP